MWLFCDLLLFAFYKHVSLNGGAAVKTILIGNDGSALVIAFGYDFVPLGAAEFPGLFITVAPC